MVEKRWHLIGFKHPDSKHSIVYKRELTTEQLLIVIAAYADKCNLFSIRGFDKEVQK